MAFTINQNFDLKNRRKDFVRQELTMEQLKSTRESDYPDDYVVAIGGKIFIYNSGNSTDGTLGKWREYKPDNILEFGGMMAVESVQVSMAGTSDIVVFYNTSTDRFVGAIPPDAETADGNHVGDYTFYNDWPGADKWGELDSGGRIPQGGKLYADTSTARLYRWNGAGLSIVGAKEEWLSEAEYEAIAEKDADTTYFVYEEDEA